LLILKQYAEPSLSEQAKASQYSVRSNHHKKAIASLLAIAFLKSHGLYRRKT